MLPRYHIYDEGVLAKAPLNLTYPRLFPGYQAAAAETFITINIFISIRVHLSKVL